MKTLKIILTTLVLFAFSATSFSQEEEKNIFINISNDVGLDESQMEPLKEIVLDYIKVLAETIDKHDKDVIDVVALYKDLKLVEDNYKSEFKTAFGEAQLESYETNSYKYNEGMDLVVTYFRALTVQIKYDLPEDKLDAIMMAVEIPVTKMLSMYRVLEYIGGEEAIDDAISAEVKAAVDNGREAEKMKMKEILSESQYNLWVN